MLGFRLTYTSRFGPGRAEIVFFSLPFFAFVNISSFCFIVHSSNIGKPSHSTHTPIFPHLTSQARGEGSHISRERGGGGKAIVPAFPSPPSYGSPFLYSFSFFTFVYIFFTFGRFFVRVFFLEKQRMNRYTCFHFFYFSYHVYKSKPEISGSRNPGLCPPFNYW